MYKKILTALLFMFFFSGFSQPISLYRQFLGQYDFTMIGNTLNVGPNTQGMGTPCIMLTQSSATLNLNANQTVAAAFLYWSGSASPTQLDLDVQLNGTPITAQRTFIGLGPTGTESWSGAFADVTDLIKITGNGNYIFSDFDINSTLAPFCPSSYNYGGWAIVIVYEDTTMSNRMVNIYDGLEGLFPDGSQKESIFITLNRM
ncbi:MAG TPA: hypothetical protein VKZ42_05725, partial [Flavobacteriaceae bacterium]|nr:hypothetical protein [Flavobacteriaceae bacterium]